MTYRKNLVVVDHQHIPYYWFDWFIRVLSYYLTRDIVGEDLFCLFCFVLDHLRLSFCDDDVMFECAMEPYSSFNLWIFKNDTYAFAINTRVAWYQDNDTRLTRLIDAGFDSCALHVNSLSHGVLCAPVEEFNEAFLLMMIDVILKNTLYKIN